MKKEKSKYDSGMAGFVYCAGFIGAAVYYISMLQVSGWEL